MSAIADRARAHGPHRVGLRPQGLAARSTRLRAAGIDARRRARAPNTWPTASTRSSCRPRSPRRTPKSSRRSERGIPVLRRAEALRAARRDPPRDRGRGESRQDHHVVDARAVLRGGGLAPQLPHRRRRQRGRHERGVRRRRVAGGRGRRERRHVPRAAGRGRHRHQRRARPPRPLRVFRRAGRRVRRLPRRRPGTAWSCRRRPARGRARRARRACTTFGFAERAPTTASWLHRAVATAATSCSRRRGTELGRVQLPVPGRHNALNAVAALALATELGVPFAETARALAGFGGVARRFQFRGERDGVTPRRRLRAPARARSEP